MGFWCRGVVVISITQLHLPTPEFKFSAGSSSAYSVPEVCNTESL